MKVSVNSPVISDESKKYVAEALESGWLSSSGPFVGQFETAFARWLGRKHAITCSNGTSALHLSLLGLGIKQGDEVIVPAFTMASVWMAVLYTGATPIFVDCEMESFNIDSKLIESKITKKTKAIIVVHIYGTIADIENINKIGRAHGLPVIEDAAEAHGAEYKGKLAGTFGNIAAFSFYANKLITTGEGGMVVTDDDKIADKIRKFKDLSHSEKRFIHLDIGYNYRMTNIQAAIGLGELSHINEYVEKKRNMANVYGRLLGGVRGLILPKDSSEGRSVYWMYAILVEKSFGMSKDELRKKLLESGIDTRDFFYPPKSQPVLKEYSSGETFPNTEYISQNGLYLPSGLSLKNEEIEYVAEQIKKIRDV